MKRLRKIVLLAAGYLVVKAIPVQAQTVSFTYQDAEGYVMAPVSDTIDYPDQAQGGDENITSIVIGEDYSLSNFTSTITGVSANWLYSVNSEIDNPAPPTNPDGPPGLQGYPLNFVTVAASFSDEITGSAIVGSNTYLVGQDRGTDVNISDVESGTTSGVPFIVGSGAIAELTTDAIDGVTQEISNNDTPTTAFADFVPGGILILTVSVTSTNPFSPTGGGGGGGGIGPINWGDPGQWGGGVVPNGDCAVAVFPDVGAPVTVSIPSSGITVGTLIFDTASADSYTLNGPGSLTIECSNGGDIRVGQGAHTVNASTYINSDTSLAIAAGSTLTFTALNSTTNNLTKTGGGALIVNHLGANSLTINTGTVQIAAQPLPSATNEINSLSIVGAPGNWLANLDITDNKLDIHYGSGADPIATVQSQLVSGLNGGAWNGTGINSSVISSGSSGGSTSVGYLDDTSTGDVVVAYTLLGDTNLDGTVDGADLGNLAANYGHSGAGIGWAQGDFDYNGVVNGADLGDLAANYGHSIGTGPDAVGLMPSFQQELAIVEAEYPAFAAAMDASVPEPSSLSLLGIAVVGVLRRRRR